MPFFSSKSFIFFSNYKISYSSLQVREDPVFRREGSDIHVDAVLSISQVMLSLMFHFIGIDML
jgi:DnaJ-class molecular chaperone